MTIIKYVTSLGPRCHTASFLKRNQLKKESYPFDWIFSNTGMILHCLEDNFKTFLDKSYYTITDPTSKKQQHSFYSDNPDEILFNHHNPLKVEDNIYFNRCIARFKNVMAQPELKMFVLFYLNFTKIDNWFKQNILDFNKHLGRHTQNYGLLCIVQYTSNKNSYRFTIHDNVHFLEIYTTSNSNGVEFENPDDNLFLDNIIMNTYKFSLIDIAPLSCGFTPFSSNEHAVQTQPSEAICQNIIIEKEPDVAPEENIIIQKEFKDAAVQIDEIMMIDPHDNNNNILQKSSKPFAALERYQSVVHKEGTDVVTEEPIVTEEIVVNQEPIVIVAIEEIVVDDEPVDEEPVDEEPVDEEPVVEEETIVVEELIDEEPVAVIADEEEPVVDEEPLAEEPVVEEPVVEEPVVEEPVVINESIANEEPVNEEPVDEEPIADEPNEIIIDEEIIDEEIVETITD